MTQRTAKLDATVQSANTDAPATAIANGRGWSRTIETIRFSPRRARSKRGVEGRRIHPDCLPAPNCLPEVSLVASKECAPAGSSSSDSPSGWRSSCSSRSGRMRCSSRPRRRSTRSATAGGRPAPRRICQAANERARGAGRLPARRPRRRGDARRAGRHRRPRHRHRRADGRRRRRRRRPPTRRAGRSCPTGRPTTGPTSRTAAISPTTLRGGENVPFREAAYEGVPISERIGTFAGDNEMESCAPPRDLVAS